MFRGIRERLRAEAGQTTAEYALVILGAAAVATLLVTWATGSDAITRLFDSVIDKIVP
jgi:Flp pilus assembly pilin Flp